MSRQAFVDAHESHRLRRADGTCSGCGYAFTEADPESGWVDNRPAHWECAQSQAEESDLCDCRWGSDPYCRYHGWL